MRIDMITYGVEGVLSGAIPGQKAFASMLVESNPSPTMPSLLFLDFSSVELATASFLRESVFALKDQMRMRNSNWYPVLANVSSDIEDELSILTQAGKDAIILCTYNGDEITDARMFGDLDPKHEKTFHLVAKLGDADAGRLAEVFGEEEGLQKATAWNNRLRTLTERGVLMEFTKGRAKLYRPAW